MEIIKCKNCNKEMKINDQACAFCNARNLSFVSTGHETETLNENLKSEVVQPNAMTPPTIVINNIQGVKQQTQQETMQQQHVSETPIIVVEKKKFNVILFVVLLLLFWPAAIIYAIVFAFKK